MSRFFPRMDWYIGTARSDRIELDRRTVTGAPRAMKGLKAVFASDFHLRPNASPDPVIDLIGSCNADVIFFGGDFADRRGQALRLFEAFGSLRAPLGMFAVPGNNDLEAFGEMSRLRDALEGCGVRLLVNESVQLDGFSVGGADEYKYGRGAAADVFSGAEGFRILISHYPVMPECGFDLMLSGHTHGGQFNAFGLTPYGIGFEGLGSKRHLRPHAVSGLHEADGAKLLVSRGIGTSRIPVRIGVKPEVHLLLFEC